MGKTSLGDVDGFVATFSKSLVSLWKRQFGTDAEDEVVSVASSRGGVVAAGNTYGVLPGELQRGDRDIFVRAYSPTGVPGWTQQTGSAVDDQSYGATATRHGVFLASTTAGTMAPTRVGLLDGVLLRYTLHRPDGLVKRSGSVYTGGNLYSPTTQRVSGQVRRGHVATFWVLAQNDGESTEKFRVKGCQNPSGLTVSFYAGTRHVTSAVRAGTFRTRILGPAGQQSLKVRVAASSSAQLATRVCGVVLTSTKQTTVKDRVVVSVTVKP